jgi:hypothetical protein
VKYLQAPSSPREPTRLNVLSLPTGFTPYNCGSALFLFTIAVLLCSNSQLRFCSVLIHNCGSALFLVTLRHSTDVPGAFAVLSVGWSAPIQTYALKLVGKPPPPSPPPRLRTPPLKGPVLRDLPTRLPLNLIFMLTAASSEVLRARQLDLLGRAYTLLKVPPPSLAHSLFSKNPRGRTRTPLSHACSRANLVARRIA